MSEYFRVKLTETAISMLREIGKRYGKKTYETLRDLINSLEFDPEQKGAALHRPLHAFHSLHYSRFRVVYQIDNGECVVWVLAAGHHTSGDRDDIYQVFQRMLDSGRIEIRTKDADK